MLRSLEYIQITDEYVYIKNRVSHYERNEGSYSIPTNTKKQTERNT
jgi:hypothetical protein